MRKVGQNRQIKLLCGGSPCLYWSVSKGEGRETVSSGMGWELFKNYKIALDKYKPDYFLYENVRSMSNDIRDAITKELGVEPLLINSALLSAQNRQRYYWTNIPNIEQPEDLGILLQDILEDGTDLSQKEKAYTLTATYYKGPTPENTLTRSQRTMVAIPLNTTGEGKAQCLRATYYKDGIRNLVANNVDRRTCVAEPIRIGTIESGANSVKWDSQANRVYSTEGKSVTLLGRGGGTGAKTGLYAVPLTGTEEKALGKLVKKYGYIPERFNAYNVAEITDKSPTLSTGSMRTSSCAVSVIDHWDGKSYPIYEVTNGMITIKGKQYPVKLADGYYIIRKLTVRECARLQTIPEWFEFPVSNTRAYQAIGNGWSIDVISHMLSYIPNIQDNKVEVLSMYDGMSGAQLALKNLGVDITNYYATEIDKYAIQITQHNFPNTIQLGDAFQVREDGWTPQLAEKELNKESPPESPPNK